MIKYLQSFEYQDMIGVPYRVWIWSPWRQVGEECIKDPLSLDLAAAGFISPFRSVSYARNELCQPDVKSPTTVNGLVNTFNSKALRELCLREPKPHARVYIHPRLPMFGRFDNRFVFERLFLLAAAFRIRPSSRSLAYRRSVTRSTIVAKWNGHGLSPVGGAQEIEFPQETDTERILLDQQSATAGFGRERIYPPIFTIGTNI
ncbi:unnamed protein product [Clonostachys rosea f. rosea IK726]|uniref:Uncharacterized protein n=1 Tax=Clonostachys rosea f. rosea IK726 TaxID=1349383 RepID=A0ACA9UFT0_BIOOC|nr:unnamed protein product [Clonostachys rosea f. rosea IK726]